MFAGMIRAAGANLLLNTTVNSISKHGSQYSVETTSANELGETSSTEDIYDTVVLAAPFQYADLELEDGLLKHIPDKIPYVRLHVTLFTSPHTLNGTHFNLKEGDTVPSTILTTLPPNTVLEDLKDEAGPAGFFSISTLRPILNPETGANEYLYKIFSPEKITSEQLSVLLGGSGK